MSKLKVNITMSLDGYVAGPNPWGKDPWEGWWGDNPPYHHPVFVLTHHAREPLVVKGGTTFFFVTNGIESAPTQARKVAPGKDVALGGGANVIQQYLAARLINEYVNDSESSLPRRTIVREITLEAAK
jgi:Dihydrofolate reductase